MNAPNIDTAMLIEALAARENDPVARFIKHLPDDMRFYAEETMRLREELVQNVQRMLACSDPSESAGYGAWIARWAPEVAYRWSSMLRSVIRWSELETESISLRIRPSSL